MTRTLDGREKQRQFAQRAKKAEAAKKTTLQTDSSDASNSDSPICDELRRSSETFCGCGVAHEGALAAPIEVERGQQTAAAKQNNGSEQSKNLLRRLSPPRALLFAIKAPHPDRIEGSGQFRRFPG